MWLIFYGWCGQLLLSAHSCSGLWSTPLLQCPCLLSMPGCQSLTFEQLSGRWLPLSKSILIHSRGRGGGWRRPPPPSSTWSFALHPLLCWWTNDQQQLIYFSEVSLEIYFSEVSLEKSRLLSNLDSSHCGMIVINHSGMTVIKFLWWMVPGFCAQWDSNFFCAAVPLLLYEWHMDSLWLLVIDVLLLQWFRKKRSFYFWEGCIY